MLNFVALALLQTLLLAFDELRETRRARSHRQRLDPGRRLLRTTLYGALFASLAWWPWRGPLALWPAALLLALLVLALTAPGRTHAVARFGGLQGRLPLMIVINLGALISLMLPELLRWFLSAETTGTGEPLAGASPLGGAAATLGVVVAYQSLRIVRHNRPPRWQRTPIRIGHSDAPRTILLTQATSTVGAAIVRSLIESGEYVIVVTADPARAEDLFGPQVRIFTDVGHIAATTRIDAVVNLGGLRRVFPAWSRRGRNAERDAHRRSIDEAIALCRRLRRRPAVLADIAAQTLASAAEPALPETRVVALRLPLVIGRRPRGRARLGALLWLIRARLGERQSPVAWIFTNDVVCAARDAIENGPPADRLQTSTRSMPAAKLLWRLAWPSRLKREAGGAAPGRDSPPAAARAQVYYNGACPVCRGELTRYREVAAHHAAPLQFVDVSETPRALAAWGLGFAQVERRLYVRVDDRLLSGVDAFVALWRTLPGYRWIAQLVALPLIHPLCELFYDGVLSPALVRWNHLRQRRLRRATLRAGPG